MNPFRYERANDASGAVALLSDASEGVITGFGVYGYLLALDAIPHLLNQKANVPQSDERSH